LLITPFAIPRMVARWILQSKLTIKRGLDCRR
jgi:hypothetical protein